MSKRAWIAAIALGLAVTFGALAQEPAPPLLEHQPIPEARQEQSAPASGNNAQEQQPTPADIAPVLQGIESAIRDLIAEEDKIERERQENREIRDLQAQVEMALWAKRMTWATGAGILLTFAGLVLIGFTLKYTKRAAEHTEGMLEQAKIATEAATDAAVAAFQAVDKAGEANALTEKTSEAAIMVATEANNLAFKHYKAEMRAYLSVTPMNAPGHAEITKPFGIRFVLRNLGTTPAQKIKAETQAFIDSFPLPQGHEMPDRWELFADGTILHNGVKDPDIVALSKGVDGFLAEAIKGVRPKMRLYAVARVQYEDCFGDPHIEQVCTTVQFQPGGTTRFEFPNQHHISE